MKLGILGGTFDPIHNGHLRMAIEAKEALKLDKVLFEVAFISPFRLSEVHADPNIRAEMVEVAIAGNPGFSIGRDELNRGGPSFTIDTVRLFPDDVVTVIVGADALAGLPEWKEPDALLRLSRIAAGRRHGSEVESTIQNFPSEWQNRIDLVPMPILEISASDIRQRVNNGRSIKHLTPDAVVQIIEQRRLYR